MDVLEDTVPKSLKILVTALFFASVALITHTLITEHEVWKEAYLLFPLGMLGAFFVTKPRLKVLLSGLSIAVIFVGGLFEPLELDAIEESFILLPLCYLVLFPGSFFPIGVALALVASYLYNLPAEEFEEFVEDAIEVLAITVFATIMTYYYEKASRQALRYRKSTYTDVLTKLPNLNAFYEDIGEVTPDNAERYAVIQIGLNNFKSVNDRLGYRNGDELLQTFSQQLNAKVPSFAKFYRLGGDEFVFLVEAEKEQLKDQIRQLVEVLHDYHSDLYVVSDMSHRLSFSLGVAFAKDALGNVLVWGKNADLALFKARQEGAGAVCWYDDVLLDETVRQHQIEAELQRALDEQHFVLHYQPKVSIQTSELVGAEALIRWMHPNLGMVSPAEFIPVAERTGKIVPLGRWVAREACREAKSWFDKGHAIVVSINVSNVQFAHDDVFKFISDALDEHQLPANLLQIEITESTLMQQPEFVIAACEKLQELGVSIAIDDFGVEYSSLNYLKKLPIDVLKIDKSFVDDCVRLHTDHMLVRTIIQMGHNLNKRVIAEGVETEDQLALLEKEGCQEYQGYFFSRPLPAYDFVGLIDGYRSDSD
ncbi:bifunctional diguanylate cyclase/phosphodiesterase [Vibrio sinaloensis]|uniref:putative bifunctional diguanylate cyclase/phosphodiesterase n=1 Tax=Photobacterium sp. (strain ATCC 43367) TaxID=379097 RepID=UPI0009E2AF1F